jgi:acyl-CoA reductase-like NAD-dependent aldehyde dehydrogenase
MLNCLIEPESLKSIEEYFKSFAEEKLQVLGGQVETLGHATFVRPAFVVMPPGSKHWRAEVEGPVVLVTTCASD